MSILSVHVWFSFIFHESALPGSAFWAALAGEYQLWTHVSKFDVSGLLAFQIGTNWAHGVFCLLVIAKTYIFRIGNSRTGRSRQMLKDVFSILLITRTVLVDTVENISLKFYRLICRGNRFNERMFSIWNSARLEQTDLVEL